MSELKGLSELKFEELPEIPRIWIDFVSSKLSFLPAPREMKKLREIADAVKAQTTKRKRLFQILTNGEILDSVQRDNIQQLLQPESVAVVTNFYPSLLGGHVSQILKCLTAVKVCEELAKDGILSVPVCWVNTAAPLGFSTRSVSLLDDESELHRLQLSEAANPIPGEPVPSSQAPDLLQQIEEFGRRTYDTEALEILRAVLAPSTPFPSPSARLAAALMKEWRLIVLDDGAPGFKSILDEAFIPIRSQTQEIQSLLQKRAAELAASGYFEAFSEGSVPACLIPSLVLPAIACVIDPHEVYGYAKALPILDAASMPRPAAWPQASATILDARSRRILERYDLSLHQLYSGEEEVVKKIMEALPNSMPEKIKRLKLEVETRVAELAAMASAESEFADSAKSCGGKVLYQLEKVQTQFEAAIQRKQQAVRHQIHKACNFLAPNQGIQEMELAGIQIPLRYSRSGLRSLYEKLDVMEFEHQLIAMD